jgi:hypothetical protein
MLKQLVVCCFFLIPTAVVLGPQADYALNKTFVGELGIILFDHYATEVPAATFCTGASEPGFAWARVPC